MPSIARPQKVYDFTAHARRQPTAPPPGDRIDAQLANHADAITAVQLAVEQLIAAQTKPIDVEGPARALIARAERAAEEITRQAGYAQALADQTQLQLKRMWAEADRARDAADRAEARLAAAVLEARSNPAPAPNYSPGQAMPSLGYGAGGFYASDDAGAAAVSADYAQVAIEWAEHMPDTIPPNILAVNAISGDHWSSRWWANRSANAFGMLAWWYQGAWPEPGPPSTPNTPTGQPLPPGSVYYDTTAGAMMVWNGSTWVNMASPQKGATASLYYLATAGQTVFPLGAVDRNGKTFAFNQTNPEGVQAYVNGVRLEPTFDFTVDTVASSVTFLRGLTVNSVAAFDLLTPATQLTPSGTVNTVLLNPIVPDGVKTVFTGLTVAMNGHPVNVAKNEELLRLGQRRHPAAGRGLQRHRRDHHLRRSPGSRRQHLHRLVRASQPMTVTRAFDLAQFVATPANVNDGVVVTALGPPFTTAFKPVVTSVNSGVTVGSSTPAATAQGQTLVSGAGPGFAWTAAASASSLPAPNAQGQTLVAGPGPGFAWTLQIPPAPPVGSNTPPSMDGVGAAGVGAAFSRADMFTRPTSASIRPATPMATRRRGRSAPPSEPRLTFCRPPPRLRSAASRSTARPSPSPAA